MEARKYTERGESEDNGSEGSEDVDCLRFLSRSRMGCAFIGKGAD